MDRAYQDERGGWVSDDDEEAGTAEAEQYPFGSEPEDEAAGEPGEGLPW